MRSELRSFDDGVDQSLLDAAVIVRRSQDAVRRMDEVIDRQRDVIQAADGAVAKARRVIGVDVDLASLERRSAEDGAPRAHVLVVDDNPAIREVLRVLLDLEVGEAAEIRTVASGADALEAASWPPHVVILDWQMPGMDGPETTRGLRGELGDDVRIVMYSSRTAAEAEGGALAAGADRYVEKGADVESLVAEVKDAVAARERRRRSNSHST